MADYLYTTLLATGILALLAGLFSFLSPSASRPAEGPFILLLREVKQCSELSPGTADFYLENFSLTRQSYDEWAFFANFTFMKSLTDKYDIRTEIGDAGTGQIRMYELRGFCTALSYYSPEFYGRLLRATNSTGCPFPEGSYELENVPLRSLKPLISLAKFPYGKYKTTAYLMEGEKKVACILMYYYIVPKN